MWAMRGGLALVLVLGAACSRTFGPPATPSPNVLGAGCVDAGECGSGRCIDGVCCASTCGRSEVCNDPRSLGHCRATGLGDSCAGDDRCTSGHCVDGVCCDIACEGDCQSCALPGFLGQCEPVAENTDPRHRCAPPCGACREGSCGPAVVGTDPNDLCASGEVCGAFGACGVFDGGGCASDADCAVGRCLDGRCLEIELQELQTPGMLPANTPDLFRWPAGLARGLGGQTAVLFTEGELGLSSKPSAHDLMLVLVERGGPAATLDLLQDRGTEDDSIDYSAPIAAAVVPLAGGYYVVAGPQAADYFDCAASPNSACTVVGWYVSSGGVVGPRELVARQSGGAYFNSLHLAVLDGGLAVQFDEYLELPDGGYPEAREFNLRRDDGGWQPVRFEYEPLDRIAGIVSTGSGPWVVGLSGDTDIFLERLDGTDRSTRTVEPRCSSLGFDSLAVAGRGAPATDTLLDLVITEGCTFDSTNTRPLQHLTVDTSQLDAPLWSAAEDAGSAVAVSLAPGFAGDGMQLTNVHQGVQDELGSYGHLELGFRSGGGWNEALVYNALGNSWVGPTALAGDRSNLPAVVFNPADVGSGETQPRLLLVTIDR